METEIRPKATPRPIISGVIGVSNAAAAPSAPKAMPRFAIVLSMSPRLSSERLFNAGTKTLKATAIANIAAAPTIAPDIAYAAAARTVREPARDRRPVATSPIDIPPRVVMAPARMEIPAAAITRPAPIRGSVGGIALTAAVKISIPPARASSAVPTDAMDIPPSCARAPARTEMPAATTIRPAPVRAMSFGMSATAPAIITNAPPRARSAMPTDSIDIPPRV